MECVVMHMSRLQYNCCIFIVTSTYIDLELPIEYAQQTSKLFTAEADG